MSDITMDGLKKNYNSNVSMDDFLNLMRHDLSKEYSHMHFYLHSSIVIIGLHREELGEFFLKEAMSEMKHVEEFGKMILGMGGSVDTKVSPYPTNLKSDVDILRYIADMESEVVHSYHIRMKQAENLNTPEGSVLHVFYENQILDSRLTFNHVTEMLKGYSGN